MFDFKYDIPLGIEYGDYDDQIIGSSQQWSGYYPVNGKLNSSTAWCPSSDDKDKHPWIQVNLKEEKFMTSVTLQGRKDANQYVTKFRVLYSKDGKIFEHLEEFMGLTNVTQTQKYWFNIPVFCKAIKLQVLEYSGHPSLRFEFGYIPNYLVNKKIVYLNSNETKNSETSQ